MIEQKIREILKVDCIRREPECAGIRKDCLGCEWADNLTQSLLAALQPTKGELAICLIKMCRRDVEDCNDCDVLAGQEAQLAHDKLTMVELPSKTELVSIFSKAGIPPPYDFTAALELRRLLKEGK